MIQALTLVFLTLVSALAPADEGPRALEKAPLVFVLGEQRLLTIQGLSRYSLGSAVVRSLPIGARARLVKPGGSPHLAPDSRLLIKAVAPGAGDLWVWKTDGSSEHRPIRVVKSAASDLKPALERAVGRLQEAEVFITPSGVTLRGEIRSEAELERIALLRDGFAAEVSDQTTAVESVLKEAEARLEAWLARSPYAGRLRIERFDSALWLRGSLEHERERRAAEVRARSLFAGVRLELSTLPDDAPTVHFKVFLLELKRSRFRTFGLSWPGTQEGALRVTTGGIQDLLQLDLALEALEGEGAARILSNPELAVRAPGEAELFSGGELPIQMQNKYFSNVTWKNFGLTLKLKVTHTTGAKVRLDVLTEVSHLDPSLATDGKVPGIQANRMKTQVDARYGRPLFLSGLLQRNMRDQARGLPLLKDIPVLGALFGSRDYLEERSELVAILLPSTAPPEAPLERVERGLPRGPVPVARNWVSLSEERALRSSSAYPWNALEEGAGIGLGEGE